MQKNTKHWAFDLDGTLVNSFPFYLGILGTILAKHEMELTSEDQISCLGQPAVKFLNSKIGETNTQSALPYLFEKSCTDAREIKPFAGILDVLKTLRANKAKIAVWTSRDKATASLVIEHSGLKEHVDLLVSSCCVTQHKPDPEGLHYIATQFSCKSSDMIMVGDHHCDVLAAKNGGAYGVRANWHGYDAPEKCAIANIGFKDVTSFAKWAESYASEGV